MASYPRGLPPPGQIIAVLAIIGLMTAILYPVFQKPRSFDNHHPCQSNLSQLGLALIQYTQDADEKYPPGINSAGSGWAGQIYPFIKTVGVYHCPKDAQDGKFISYAENRNLACAGLTDLAQPAATVELYEFSTLNCDPSQSEAVSATGLSAPQNSIRHDSDTLPSTYSLYFLAADGHVRLLRPWQVSGGISAVSPKKLLQGAGLETFAVK